MDEIKIVIPTNPITKKNHQEIHLNRKTGKHFIAQSKAYGVYEEMCGYYLMGYHNIETIKHPVNVKCLFYMSSKRGKLDLSNLLAACHDILVKYRILDDDCHLIIKSIDGSRVLYDKNNPRTEIYITDYIE